MISAVTVDLGNYGEDGKESLALRIVRGILMNVSYCFWRYSMFFVTQKFFRALPAVVFVAGVLAFGAISFGGSMMPSYTELPTKSDARLAASDNANPSTTARDWQEVNGTRTKRGWR
jgi:hypothetical protein